eukprot:TRINITY_DN5209_c0_g1_i1.p1 TRINITY_DN5209_c0_g1~~TRINITY_DN5209_c0_g1_i1.p1  ORF type:complete len:225 (-),score=16.44 TRINITY_DN5209_c0_g1_i1:1440-2114(-)
MVGVGLKPFLGNWRRWWICRQFRTRVFEPSMLILRRGAEPGQLALSVAVGFVTGVFPLCGLCAMLCGFFVFFLGSLCHPPTCMLANFIVTPLELSLIIPFMRFGERVLNAPPLSISPDAIWKALQGKASHRLLLSLWHAVLGWAVAAPLLTYAVYRLSLPLIRTLTRKFPPSLTVTPSPRGAPSPEAFEASAVVSPLSPLKRAVREKEGGGVGGPGEVTAHKSV